MPDANADFRAALLEVFKDEAADLARQATRDLLELEKGGPQAAEHYHSLGRCLHSIKGTAATCGLENSSRLAHRLEDLLAPHKAKGAALPGEVADRILKGVDSIVAAAAGAAAGGQEPAFADEAEGATPSADASAPGEAAGGGYHLLPGQLDGLFSLAEGLRNLHARLLRRAREAPEDAAGRQPRLDAQEAGRLSGEFEELVRAVCTLPARGLLEPLQRSVRDLCRATGKRAAISLVGAELRVDRRLIEGLREPLMHLVRNAVDHGLESPAEREARGKDGQGSLVVRVEQQGNRFFLEVSDDGRGVDWERVRARAAEMALAPGAELAAMGAGELQSVLFQPGFSTAKEVSQLSGRGVGLDVVRSKVEALGGFIEVDSRAGQGTRFLVDLPLALGASSLLCLGVEDQVFALPFSRILAVTSWPAQAGAELLSFRDEAIPWKDLGASLGLRPARSPAPGAPTLVLQGRSGKLAVVADRVEGEEELLVQAMPPCLAGVPAYQGAAALPDGGMLLVLRNDWFFKDGDGDL